MTTNIDLSELRKKLKRDASKVRGDAPITGKQALELLVLYTEELEKALRSKD